MKLRDEVELLSEESRKQYAELVRAAKEVVPPWAITQDTGFDRAMAELEAALKAAGEIE